MDIGQKLKNARTAANLTQESVAEQIGISRQTISSWENNRTYPDIISIIQLSDLYQMSLDALLKEDKKMLDHLQESTDIVKSHRKLSNTILITAYLVIWALLMILYWCFTGPTDAMAYSLLADYIVLPLTTAVISFQIGKDDSWANWKWAVMLFFGIMYMMAGYATFPLSNMIHSGITRYPDPALLLPGILCSAAGLGVGSLYRVIRQKRTHM